MKKAIVSVEMLAPYCQSRRHETPKKNKELHADYEKRTWKERLNYDKDTKEIYVPAMAFSNCVKEVAKYLSRQIPGKGKATYTKHFEAGIQVPDHVMTGKYVDDAQPYDMYVPSDGKRGGGTRVQKFYPVLYPPLSLQVEYLILDDVITPEIFAEFMQQAGQLIGIGSFRVRNNGVFGRFRVSSIDWIEESEGSKLPPINYINSGAKAA